MIKRTGKLPPSLYLAFSGGLDSSAVLNFLLNTPREIKLAHVHHGTSHSDEAFEFVKNLATELDLELITHRIETAVPTRTSKEAYWRDCRYRFFHSLPGPVVTCHHLDDQVETWIFTALNGIPRLIPYRNKNVVRPFLLTSREEFREWAEKNHLTWIEDPSNKDTSFARNQIRHNVIPECLKVNPGLRKVIRKKVWADSL
jgi:tRNA(Ile)-lysidine synthase